MRSPYLTTFFSKQTAHIWLGLCLLIILLPLQTRYIWNPEATQFLQRSIYGFDILVIALGAYWTTWWYRQRTNPPIITISLVGLVYLIILGLQYWSIDSQHSVHWMMRWFEAICIIIIMRSTKLPRHWLLTGFVISGSVQAVVSLLQFILQNVQPNKWLGLAAQYGGELGAPVITTADGRWLRAFGTWPHPNIAAGFFVITLLSAYWLWLHYQHSWQRVLIAAASVVMASALVLTFSRTAMIAFVISSGLAVVLQKQLWRVSLYAMLSVAAISMIVWPLWFSRINVTAFTEQYSLTEREAQLQEATSLLPQNWNWFSGTGLNTYTVASALDNPQPVHNTLLLLGVELGLPLTAFLFIVYLYSLWLGFTKKSLKNAYVLTVGISALLLSMLDHYWLTSASMLLVLAFIVSQLPTFATTQDAEMRNR